MFPPTTPALAATVVLPVPLAAPVSVTVADILPPIVPVIAAVVALLPIIDTLEYSTTTITVGGYQFVIRALKDKQQYADPTGSAELAGINSSTWSLFGNMWPSGRLLAELVDVHEMTGLRVLELGCGLGLASLVAHRHGVDMTASDYNPAAGEFLAENVSLNHFAPLAFNQCDWSKLQPEMGDFDLIIGSDLLYEPNHPALLSTFIDRHSAAAVEVIIIDPDRRQQREFTRAMEGLGYVYSMARASSEQIERLQFKGKIMTYRRG
jgi:predicted nicotinamide N-methyase